MNFDIIFPKSFEKEIIILKEPGSFKCNARVIVPNRGVYLVEPVDDLTLKIIQELSVTCQPEVSISFGICRPQIARKILFSIGVFGAKQLTVFESKLIEGDYKTSNLYQRPEQILWEGMRQSGNYIQPNISIIRFDQLLQTLDPIETVVFDRLVGQRCSTDHIARFNSFVLGPEKGFTECEINEFLRLGCHIVSLGNLILRSHQIVDLVFGIKLMAKIT